MEMISWGFLDDEVYHRQELAHGRSLQLTIHGTGVLTAGAGGIGSKIAEDLTKKGFGRVTIVDPDTIDRTNLSRLSFPETFVGRKKAIELARMLQALRPSSIIRAFSTKIQDVPHSEIKKHHLIISATDSAKPRLHVNDLSLAFRIPSIQVGASLENGIEAVSVRLVVPAVTPCYECWNSFTSGQMFDYMTDEEKDDARKRGYGIPNPTPSVVDLNTVAAGYVGIMTAKFLTRQRFPPYWYVDLKKLELETYWQKRNPQCPRCSHIPDWDVEMVSGGENHGS